MCPLGDYLSWSLLTWSHKPVYSPKGAKLNIPRLNTVHVYLYHDNVSQLNIEILNIT